MRTTISVIKADVGSVDGHTLPSAELLEIAREHSRKAHGRLPGHGNPAPAPGGRRESGSVPLGLNVTAVTSARM